MAWLEKINGNYRVAWYGPDGKRLRQRLEVDGFPVRDKLVARDMLATWERDVARGGVGLADPFKQHRNRPLLEHVGDWIGELRQKGRAPGYIKPCESRLARLARECQWQTLDDISADAFCKWRETATSDEDHNRLDKSTRTIRTLSPAAKNRYLSALIAFCAWCVKRKRMPAPNPAADIEKIDETIEVRRERRALSADELRRLLAVVPDHYRLGYQILMATGLRRGELLALRWGDVRLGATLPYLQLRAADTKAGRNDALPLRQDLADLLRQARGESTDADRVVKVLPRIPKHKKYLAAADIPWQDDAGRRADLHALRHSYATLLATSGVSVREAMSLMRHADVRLTARTYTHLSVFNLAGAVERLPLQLAKPAYAEALAATGTDNTPCRDVVNALGANQGARSTGTCRTLPYSAALASEASEGETSEKAQENRTLPHSAAFCHESKKKLHRGGDGHDAAGG